MGVLATIALALLISTVSVRGFTVDIFRRGSPKSPFYKHSLTWYDHLGDALQRSVTRAYRMSQTSRVVSADGEYLLGISIGTPPVKITAIADTGSDLMWTQCTPCQSCYDQNAPLFDPSRSSTYATVPCESDACTSLDNSACDDSGVCQYTMTYGDDSHSSGVLSTDSITLGTSAGTPASLPTALFGCGSDNAGTFNANGSGIVGLGGGNSSLVSQMKSLIGGKFSYCLLPMSDTEHASKMNFGADAIVSGPGSISTPIVPRAPSTYYFLTLESFSVGNSKTKVPFTGGSDYSESEEGNIMIDSGTTLTLLPTEVYQQLESAVSKQIRGPQLAKDPQGTLQLCYRSRLGEEFVAPVITAHFTGADVQLNPLNTFVRISDEVICFAFAANPSLAIFGNLAQMNFLVGYNLIARTVSFKPADCSQL